MPWVWMIPPCLGGQLAMRHILPGPPHLDQPGACQPVEGAADPLPGRVVVAVAVQGGDPRAVLPFFLIPVEIVRPAQAVPVIPARIRTKSRRGSQGLLQ